MGMPCPKRQFAIRQIPGVGPPVTHLFAFSHRYSFPFSVLIMDDIFAYLAGFSVEKVIPDIRMQEIQKRRFLPDSYRFYLF